MVDLIVMPLMSYILIILMISASDLCASNINRTLIK